MRLLDLYCGAGGSARGYELAGFDDIVGVDITAQPNYPYPMVVDDALDWLEEWVLSGHELFDAVHASPPCQVHVKGMRAVNQTIGRADEHRDLIALTRELLHETELPWIMENVVGSPIDGWVRLCGTSFGLPLRRHRLFESSHFLFAEPCRHELFTEKQFWNGDRSVRVGEGRREYTGHDRLSSVVQVYGHAGGKELWPEAMGIDWMTSAELAEAIPPAYTQFLGAQLLSQIGLESGRR